MWGLFFLCMAVEIKLSDAHKVLAWDEATRRQSQNEEQGRKGRNRAAVGGTKALGHHLFGTAGEIAVAIYLDLEDHLFLEKEPIKNSRDLPFDIDVKCRPNHGWDLLVQLDDDPTKNFVLVTIQKQVILIQGWISGRDAMSQGQIKEYVKGRPAYSIDKSLLKSPESLKDHVATVMGCSY